MSASVAPRVDPGTTGFGATVFGTAIENLAPAASSSAFDVCHVGVVLRGMLVAAAEKFHHAIAGSQLIVYPEVGHLPQIEIPARSAADALRFLDAHPGR